MKQSEKGMSTEDKILEAAFDVVQEKAISGTRIHLVAERAGLFQSNIHYYFKSKKELLFAVLNRLHERCLEIRSDMRSDAEDTLEGQLDIFFAQKKYFITAETKYDYAEIDFWTHAHNDEEIRRRFQDSFARWREEIGCIITRYRPYVPRERREFVCAMMVSMMEGATIQYLVDDTAFDPDDYFARCKQVVLSQLDG